MENQKYIYKLKNDIEKARKSAQIQYDVQIFKARCLESYVEPAIKAVVTDFVLPRNIEELDEIIGYLKVIQKSDNINIKAKIKQALELRAVLDDISFREQDYNKSSRKCKYCGNILDELVSVCPSCGIEQDIEYINQTTQVLATKIERDITQSRISGQNIKKTVNNTIRYFVLPSGKAELFDIINYLDSISGIYKEAKIKRNEAARRALLLYPHDSGIVNLIKMLKIKI